MMKTISLIPHSSPAALCNAAQQQGRALLAATRKTYGILTDIPSRALLPLADRYAQQWLQQSQNPYHDEIAYYAKTLDVPGVFALNLSYEWGCTSGAYQTEHAPTMMRVLDWPFPGLGEALTILHQDSQAGEFYNVTWPAVSGVFQAMAPGRFAAAINQAPRRMHGLTPAGDWLKNRHMVRQETALPPAHLLRHVFETACCYAEAKRMLTETPVCIPVIYTLTGTHPGEGCVIERLETDAQVRELGQSPQVSTSNHFQSSFAARGKGWKSRALDSQGRAHQARALQSHTFSRDDFRWLTAPIINPLTRLCMIADAASGEMTVQGWEAHGPVTQPFTL